MFDSIFTFFYSTLVYIANYMPTKSIGLAIVIMAIIVHVVLYGIRNIHIKHRLQHQIIHHKINQLSEKTSAHIQKIYESFTYMPWRGFQSSMIYALVFFFFFFVIQQVISFSPSDIEHLYFDLSLIPQNINYEFIGENIASKNYSSWYLVGFSFFVFLSMFIHSASRWRYEKNWDAKHLIELMIILFVSKIFMLMLRNFSFGALIYWWSYVMVALIIDIISHPNMLADIHNYFQKLEKRTAQEKKHAFMKSHGIFHKLMLRTFAKSSQMKIEEAVNHFHARHHHINHGSFMNALRHQLVSYPYLIIVILMAIYFAFIK